MSSLQFYSSKQHLSNQLFHNSYNFMLAPIFRMNGNIKIDLPHKMLLYIHANLVNFVFVIY